MSIETVQPRHGTASRRRRQAAIAVAGAAVLAIVLVVALGSRNSGASSSVDGQLKQTADRVLPSLNHPHGKLPVEDASIRSFQAWFYDEQPVFSRLARRPQPPGQYFQVQFVDPNTMPPQDLGLNAPGRAFVRLEDSVTSAVGQSGRPQYTSASGNGNVRVYVAPIALPTPMQGSGIYGLVEVISES